MTVEEEHSWEDVKGPWVQPLVLSLLAGLSTCLGAACVFCLHNNNNNNNKGGKNNKAPLRHGHMAFSLSLAGSVMVTVSFVSILPESLQDESFETTDGAGVEIGEYQMIPIQSSLFAIRCLCFGVGCLLYVLLSKCAFPEPDAILGLDEEAAALRAAASRPADDDNDDDSNGGDEEHAALVPETKLTRRVAGSSISDDEGASVTSSPPGPTPLVKRQSSLKRRDVIPTQFVFLNNSGNYNGDNNKNINNNRNEKTNASVDRPDTNSNSTGTHWLIHCSRGNDLQSNSARRAWRVTMLLFISLAVHNFPEGLAVAASTMHSVQLGLTTAVAIALHNIPEGIAIAVPCLAARPDSPWLAFWLASVSGLAEPLGALVALFLLGNHATMNVPNDPSWLSMNNVLAFVSGIMTTVAFIELFPEALRHGDDGRIPFGAGLLAGVVVMVGSDMYLDT